MKLKTINKILTPLYFYILAFIIFYSTIQNVSSGFWNNFLFYTMLLVLPFFVLLLTNLLLLKTFKKPNKLSVLTFSSLPGLIAGIWLGYGMYSAIFAQTLSSLIQSLLFVGLFGALTTGTLGLLINFFINLIKRK